MKSKVSIISLFVATAFCFSCEPQLVDDPIPFVTFNDLTINIGLPDYATLRVDGGLKLINNIGLHGVIVYRVNATTFHAYERNCSYHPNEAGSTVDIHTSNLYFIDYSCGSQFNLTEGQPTGGPAWRPLRQYRTELSSSFLTITSDVIN